MTAIAACRTCGTEPLENARFVMGVASRTIVTGSDGTRFTNDGTGHGMFVSIENVSSF
jgi:hypothetical protein